MYLKKIKILIIFTSIILSMIQLAYAAKPATKASGNSAIEQEILVHINEYRQQHGLKTLKMDSRISREARNHSIDMANHTMPFGHKYFKSRIDRLHTAIKNSGAGAENVAYNYKDAQDVVKNWLRSPGHKRNIDGNYDMTGIGIAKDEHGKIYFTQIFLRTGSEQSNHVARRPFGRLFGTSLFIRNA